MGWTIWVSRRNVMDISSNLLKDCAAENENMMKNHLRMSKIQFQELLSKVLFKFVTTVYCGYHLSIIINKSYGY